jgi:hypothetical protein
MEKYNQCTATEFKTDISELCEKCPLTKLINSGIENQIISQAQQQKEILNKEQFKNYIDDEVKNAQTAMQKVFLTEQQNKDYKTDIYRKERVKNYIWNKERIKALVRIINDVDVVSINKHTDNSSKFTIRQIALKHVYENKSITRENGNSIAKKYGHHSGEKLFQVFTEYSSPTNRKGAPTNCTEKKLRNKIELFESVIETLSEKYKEKAIGEVDNLKRLLLNNNY